MKKGKSTALFIVCTLLIGLMAYAGFGGMTLFDTYRVKTFSETIDKGLDLVGGISVTEEIQEESVDSETMDRTIELISMRVNKLGVGETVVTKDGDKRIRIEVPGKFDSEEVIKLIGKTGELQFVGPDGEVILTGKDVKNARGYLNAQQMNTPTVSLEFNEEGRKKFAEATRKFIGQKITIQMDGETVSDPTVNSAITDGNAVIEGMKDLQSAQTVANVIKSGALPVVIKPVSYKTVGSTLGENALPLSMKAAAIGVGLVFIFMIILFKIPGLIADIALTLFIILDLGVFASMNGVLTLAGISGLLLTIGMAVDANVLIFSRIKEELKLGKSVRAAMESGYNRALSSILDGNITTLIAAIILYSIGSGSVKGFALTLMIGIVISIFTALTFTKMMLKLAMNMGLIKKASHFGVKGGRA